MVSTYNLTFNATGATILPVYAIAREGGTGKYWNGSAYEDYDPGHWSTYVLAVADLGGGMLKLSLPVSTFALGSTVAFTLCHQAGGSSAPGDDRVYTTTARHWGRVREDGDSGTPVDHNTGGTDALRFTTEDGDGIAGTVRAYVASDYAADPAAAMLRGRTKTGDDGRWLGPIYLTAGVAHRLTFDADRYALATATVTPPEVT